MLDPEWPEPLPAASGASRTAKRLALAAARRDLLAAPARQIARERRVLLFHSRVCQAVRAGLTALGFDPALSRLLVENEGLLAAELAALPPAENDPPPPPEPSHPAPLGAHAEQWKANFRRQADRFREPSAAPPNLASELMFTLWAFVYARSPRNGLMPFGPEWVAAYDADMAADDAAAPDEAGSAESDRYY